MAAAAAYRMPQRETGWSPRHDVERTKLHAFRNAAMELALIAQLGQLGPTGGVQSCVAELERMYLAELRPARRRQI